MSEAPRLHMFPEKERSQVWRRLVPGGRPANWDNIGGPVIHLESNLPGHLLAGLQM